MVKRFGSSHLDPRSLHVHAQFSLRVAGTGGRSIAVRCVQPDDKEALREGFKHLSAETRYRRFHAHVARLSPAMLRYLTEVDGWDHVAIVAVVEATREERARVVGVARAVRFAEEPHIAELALAVADDMQGRGLGAVLVEVLVLAVRERGIAVLQAQTFFDDRAVRRLLLPYGMVVHRIDGGAQLLELHLQRRSA